MTLHKDFIIQSYSTASGIYKFICAESHKSEKISEESETSAFMMLKLYKLFGNQVKENSVKYKTTSAVTLIYY